MNESNSHTDASEQRREQAEKVQLSAGDREIAVKAICSRATGTTAQVGAGQKLQQVQDFLDQHEGFKSFLWAPPGSGQGRYTSNGYKLSTLGGGLHSLSTNFKQTFRP
ncbi:phage tail protein [Pseudomonas coronafaciens]|uniref:phage tail protein n=1 Tax=Pseudomonas coronafaciens TaxID=53409 RepID=UPI0037A12BA7